MYARLVMAKGNSFCQVTCNILCFSNSKHHHSAISRCLRIIKPWSAGHVRGFCELKCQGISFGRVPEIPSGEFVEFAKVST